MILEKKKKKIERYSEKIRRNFETIFKKLE